MPIEPRERDGGRSSRRHFLRQSGLLIGGAAALGGAGWGASRLIRKFGSQADLPFAGEIVGLGAARGHRLRDIHSTGAFSTLPTRKVDVGVLIVGGGVTGISAARALRKSGVDDFRVLELEDAIGGNSAWGQNHVSRYPWGAHYLPLPAEESVEVRELLRELGALERGDGMSPENYREDMLCGDPSERLWIFGMWQEGLVPKVGLTSRDRAQFTDFFAEMGRLRVVRGRDGKRPFALPLERSSLDPEWLALDQITFAQYIGQKGWDSAPLRWYLDYCCRDDYGAAAARVSAWAGIHYFAARPTGGALLTWPQGNGWLIEKMGEGFRDRVSTAYLAYAARETSAGVEVDAWEFASGNAETPIHRVTFRAQAAVLAVPRFVAARMLEAKSNGALPEYAPWMVANITLSSAREFLHDQEMAWDNVSYHSRSLGYVHARHQDLTRDLRETVLTQYWPLDDLPPREARSWALARTHAQWSAQAVEDLARMHHAHAAELRSSIERIDVRLWGHAMPIPAPGWITRCRSEPSPISRIIVAHSDRSGLSLFEQAFYQGLRAADHVSAQLRGGARKARVLMRARSIWIRSARFDGALILAPPFVATLGAAVWQWQSPASSLSPWAWLGLVVGVDVAHVYSALFRTYLSPRFPHRLAHLLWLTPVAAWGFGALCFAQSPLSFWRVLAYLAVFHFVRQPYGLLRIYARGENARPWERALDAIAVYGATLLPLLDWHLRGGREFHWFVDGDFISQFFWRAILPGRATQIILQASRALGIGITLGFVANELRRAYRDQCGLAWGKLGVVLGTACSWWVGIVVFNSDSVFTATNVLSHGVPYVALVWAVNQRAIGAESSGIAVLPVSPPTGLRRLGELMLSPRAWPLYIAFLLVLAFGEELLWDSWIWREHRLFFGHFWSWSGGPVADPSLRALIVPLLAVPQATHYVLDAWVWKSRYREVYRASS